MDKILLIGLGAFVVLSIIASYGYYVSSVLGSEVSYTYQGVCTQYSGNNYYPYYNQTVSPLYNQTKCSQLELQSAASSAAVEVLVILVLVDIAFMVMYWVFEVRESGIRQSKQTKK